MLLNAKSTFFSRIPQHESPRKLYTARETFVFLHLFILIIIGIFMIVTAAMGAYHRYNINRESEYKLLRDTYNRALSCSYNSIFNSTSIKANEILNTIITSYGVKDIDSVITRLNKYNIDTTIIQKLKSNPEATINNYQEILPKTLIMTRMSKIMFISIVIITIVIIMILIMYLSNTYQRDYVQNPITLNVSNMKYEIIKNQFSDLTS